MLNTILVPLDQSPLAEQALGVAEAIARAANARLSVVLAHHMAPYDGSLVGSWSDAKDAAESAYVRRIVDEIGRGSQVAVSGTVSAGAPVETICRRAREVMADLIVLTSHGRTGLSRAWLGSVADGVVRTAQVPVLMIRGTDAPATVGHGNPSPLFKRILVPLDGSTTSSAILPHAAAIARCTDARLILVRVVQPVPMFLFDAQLPAYATNVEDPDATKQLVEDTELELSELAPKIEREYSIKAETVVAVAPSAAQAILNVAKAKQADLIAMTTHGRGASRLVVGSVTDKVLRGGALPLLLFHPSVVLRAAERAPRRRAGGWSGRSRRGARGQRPSSTRWWLKCPRGIEPPTRCVEGRPMRRLRSFNRNRGRPDVLILRGPTLEAPARSYDASTPALAPELGRAFAAWCQHVSRDGDRRLRDVTTALVQRLKRDGVAPERVVVAIKTAIARYGNHGEQPSLWGDTDLDDRPAHAAYKRVFGWMLDTYFATTDAGSPP